MKANYDDYLALLLYCMFQTCVVSFELKNNINYLPNTEYTWTPGIATHFLLLYDFIIIGNMLLNVFLQVLKVALNTIS